MEDQQPALRGPTTLVVAWRTGRNAVGRVVKAGGAVTNSLRQSALRTLQSIRDADGMPYDPNDEQDEEVVYLEADREELLDTALLDQIFLGASLPLA